MSKKKRQHETPVQAEELLEETAPEATASEGPAEPAGQAEESAESPAEPAGQAEESAATPAEPAEQSEEPSEEQAVPEEPDLAAVCAGMKEQLAQWEDRFLRLAAEYDNYRKRTAKEKEGLWSDAKADTIQAILPVYDNLERALHQETADEAYKKGVEMTMNQLKEVFAKLGLTEIEALGKTFDPNLHNAVMHVEDEEQGESTVTQVFQTGFMLGDRVIRFAMVQVAN